MRFHIIAWRILVNLRRDRRTLALILLGPIIIMVVFSFVFSGEVRDARIIVVNMDSRFQAKLLVDTLNPEVFNVEYYDDLEKALAEVKEGRAWMVIVIPAGFTESLMGGGGRLKVYIDRSNVMVADKLIGELMSSIMRLSETRVFKPPLLIDIDYVYGGDIRFIDAFMPGVAALAIFILSTVLTLISFVVERRTYTLYRVLATPAREYDIVLGYSLSFSLIGAIQVVEIFLISIIAFDVKIRGSLILAVIVGSLLAVTGVNLGLLLSSLLRTEAQAPQVIPIVMVPSLLLSGVFWPVEAIPEVMRPFSYMIPLTYAVESIRSIVVRGWGLEELAANIAILIAFSIMFTTLSIITISRRD